MPKKPKILQKLENPIKPQYEFVGSMVMHPLPKIKFGRNRGQTNSEPPKMPIPQNVNSNKVLNFRKSTMGKSFQNIKKRNSIFTNQNSISSI